MAGYDFFGVPTQTLLEMAGSTSGLLEEFCTPGGLMIVADPTIIGLLYTVFFLVTRSIRSVPFLIVS